MKKLSRKEHQRQLDVIAAIPGDAIGTSDVPELTEEHFRRGVRGMFYRPIKKPVTMRFDADVIAWLKQDGPGYQTKANALLRREMMRSNRPNKAEQQLRKSRENASRIGKYLKTT